MSLREQLPELNDAQWKLLERELVAALPAPMLEEGSVYDPAHKLAVFHNAALTGSAEAIRKALA